MPTLRIARMAGQFAKPRSKDTEIVEGVEMPAFRGDNVNSYDTSARCVGTSDSSRPRPRVAPAPSPPAAIPTLRASSRGTSTRRRR